MGSQSRGSERSGHVVRAFRARQKTPSPADLQCRGVSLPRVRVPCGVGPQLELACVDRGRVSLSLSLSRMWEVCIPTHVEA